MANIDRVIITGASSGIGLDIARAFLAQGSSLILNARDEGKLAQARASLGQDGEHGKVLLLPGAIGDASTAERLAELARRELGGVDVLINNAGIFAMQPFLQTSVADL